jgi:hypothetical protein
MARTKWGSHISTVCHNKFAEQDGNPYRYVVGANVCAVPSTDSVDPGSSNGSAPPPMPEPNMGSTEHDAGVNTWYARLQQK